MKLMLIRLFSIIAATIIVSLLYGSILYEPTTHGHGVHNPSDFASFSWICMYALPIIILLALPLSALIDYLLKPIFVYKLIAYIVAGMVFGVFVSTFFGLYSSPLWFINVLAGFSILLVVYFYLSYHLEQKYEVPVK
ncbi:hypothetical protein Q7A53_16845 [Halobacillus rhizosphaerae]|uniref:hypothetical protein n=1 Tax=Halobacillus rhizosphaerae TaxID=3064889 RepID=UPI00398AFF55